LWLARAPREERPPLVGRRETDVVIVGAGLTGLWTALFLKRLDPSRDVVVVETGVVGYGASGRNAGILSPTIDHSHALAVAHFGKGEARRLADLGRENLREMTSFLAARGIDCGLERTGQLHVALDARQAEALGEAERVARGLGVTGYRLLSGDEVRARLESPRYVAGLFDPDAAILDPVKLVRGLAREAVRLGVAIHERTPVEALDATRGGVLARTPAGTIEARRAILATSAYSHRLLPRLRHRFLPLYDYVLASEPLAARDKDALGWRGREAVTDGRSFFNYYRLTEDDRVVWGSSEAAYYSGNRVDEACDHSPRHYQALRESFAWHFPRLAHVEFTHAWGGAICATTRFTPFFGSAQGDRLLYGLGFTGHGLGTTHLAGKILAHLAARRPSPLLDLPLVTRAPFPYPPEPLRSLAVAVVTRALRRTDAGGRPGPLLALLDRLGIGLSS